MLGKRVALLVRVQGSGLKGSRFSQFLPSGRSCVGLVLVRAPLRARAQYPDLDVSAAEIRVRRNMRAVVAISVLLVIIVTPAPARQGCGGRGIYNIEA